MKLKATKRQIDEVFRYKLVPVIIDGEICETERSTEYTERFEAYQIQYRKRPPLSRIDQNMIRALRLCPWLNSPDDWARLHACEMCRAAALREKRKRDVEIKRTILGNPLAR